MIHIVARFHRLGIFEPAAEVRFVQIEDIACKALAGHQVREIGSSRIARAILTQVMAGGAHPVDDDVVSLISVDPPAARQEAAAGSQPRRRNLPVTEPGP